jgi:hypothetical protein
MRGHESSDTLKHHLESLERLSLATAALMLASIWSAFQNADEIQIFGISAKRDNVFLVLAFSLSAVCLAASLYYVRLRRMIYQVEEGEVSAALATITRHSWLFNPFANFSEGGRLSLSDAISRASMPFLWTLGIGCLWSISIPYETWLLLLSMFFYILCGLTMTFYIISAVSAVDRLFKNIGTTATMRREGIVLSGVGICLGAATPKLIDTLYYYYSTSANY